MRRELNNAEFIAFREVSVESPAEFLVKCLCTIDIGNADYYHFEFHFQWFTRFCRCHDSPPSFSPVRGSSRRTFFRTDKTVPSVLPATRFSFQAL